MLKNDMLLNQEILPKLSGSFMVESVSMTRLLYWRYGIFLVDIGFRKMLRLKKRHTAYNYSLL